VEAVGIGWERKRSVSAEVRLVGIHLGYRSPVAVVVFEQSMYQLERVVVMEGRKRQRRRGARTVDVQIAGVRIVAVLIVDALIVGMLIVMTAQIRRSGFGIDQRNLLLGILLMGMWN
jgi:hypothetical protein